MRDVLKEVENGIIVSCQSEGADPFNDSPEYMALFARAAVMGGAKGIRSEGINKIRAIRRAVNVPIIGLLKSTFEDGTVKITGSFEDVERLIAVESDIIAVDGTFRQRDGLTGPEFIAEVKKKYGCIVLADIATYNEAMACEEVGVDCISTTLNGYTPDTIQYKSGPNLDLLSAILKDCRIPVFAEGRYNSPSDARRAKEMGAYAVISGTAITRPRVITSWFVEAINTQ